MVCFGIQLLAPGLRRSFYQVNAYAVVEEPAVHLKALLTVGEAQYNHTGQYKSYWTSILSARQLHFTQVACEVGAPGTLKVKGLRPFNLNEAQNLQKRTRHNVGLVTTARLRNSVFKQCYLMLTSV